MRGDSIKLKTYLNEYGYDFVIAAIEKAVEIKNADDMTRGRSKQTIDAISGEARILKKAQEMGIRLQK